MARVNNDRVEKYLDYERDIKGKRLVRLSAGVCAGKNTAFIKIFKKYPHLRVLFITSRKNTVLAQEKDMEAIKFSDFDELIKTNSNFDENTNQGIRVICTNASIVNFFKHTYKKNDKNTYLWEKFDLIVLDEAHSLTTDASYTDNFYVERFIKHTYYKNHDCDIVFMSGTITPLKWMIDAENTPKIHDLNFFDKCLHLEPKYVFVVDKEKIPEYLYYKWQKNERILYFANKKKKIAELSSYLVECGVPIDALGYSFNYSEKDKELEFPKEIAETLSDRIDYINKELTNKEKVPQHIKILFSTSKNKEGISILDDDIKTTIADTHNKANLIQIAGRVRGNRINGEGITSLIIVANEEQFKKYPDNFTYIYNKHIAKGLTDAFNEIKSKSVTEIENPMIWLKRLPQFEEGKDAYKYIRYDFIGENFVAYEGLYECEKQNINDVLEFDEIENNSVLRRDSFGQYMLISGNEILEKEWFKDSQCFVLSKHKSKEKVNLIKVAREELLEFLKVKKFIGNETQINAYDRDVIIREEIERLAEKYGYINLDIEKGFKYVGRTLKKFGIQIKEKTKKRGYETYTLHDIGIRG